MTMENNISFKAHACVFLKIFRLKNSKERLCHPDKIWEWILYKQE
jgi:hypothetical protein